MTNDVPNSADPAIRAASFIRQNQEDFDQAVELIRQNQVQEGCRILLDRLKQFFGMDFRLLDVGMLLWRSDFPDEAILILRHALESNGDDLETLVNLARILIQFQKWDEMIPFLERLRELQPEETEWYSNLAWAYFQTGNPQKCRQIISLGLEHATWGVDFQAGTRYQLPENFSKLIIQARMDEASALTGALEALYGRSSARTWRAGPVTDSTAQLRGAAVNLADGAAPYFEVEPREPGGGPAARFLAEPQDKNQHPDSGVTVWSAAAEGLNPGRSYQVQLKLEGADADDIGAPVDFATGKKTAAEIDAMTAVHAGNVGAVLAGTLGGTTLPTEYHFAYGEAEDRLDRKTAPQWVPPGRSKRIHQCAIDALEEWQVYAVEWGIVGDTLDWQSPDAFALRLISPFGKDRNHINGIGVTDLLLGWSSRFLASGESANNNTVSDDFRDAEVELVLRPKGLKGKDFLLACNTQSRTGHQSTERGGDSAPWALTGHLINPDTLDEENWNRLKFRFTNEPLSWTFCGNNPQEQPEAARYGYMPLNKVLSNHQGNIWFWFVFGDWRNPPEGTIDFQSLSLKYRDRSVLNPDAGAELTGFPEDSLSDPQCLTRGWLDNPQEMWFSAPNPEGPQEFTWRFGAGVSPRTLKLHQNTLKPAKTVEISTSADGNTFTSEWLGDLPAAKPVLNVPPAVVIALQGRPLSHLKLSIHSGYQDDFWGLDAIEAFDGNAVPCPELEPASVSEEVGDLEPGQKLYYRLVAENAAGETRGPVSVIDIPVTQKPAITDGRCLKQTGNRATLFLQVMPCGLETEISARVSGPGGRSWQGPPMPVGCNPSVRHVCYVVEGGGRKGRYRAEITATNDAGESQPFILEWEGNGRQ
ncbi:MAG: tetratricopeptide repeat protein [Proteobacteria bacterium]|nr:tetratricopeptide repeat protein [Pseudomonadota bacterium]